MWYKKPYLFSCNLNILMLTFNYQIIFMLKFKNFPKMKNNQYFQLTPTKMLLIII